MFQKNFIAIVLTFSFYTSAAFASCIFQAKAVHDVTTSPNSNAHQVSMFTESSKARCKMMNDEISANKMKKEDCEKDTGNFNGHKVQLCKWENK